MPVRFLFFLLSLYCLCTHFAQGQERPPASDDEIRFVVVLVRHGVRAPIESEIRGSAYNAEPWPAWSAAPGVLTQHGAAALRLLGEYYRLRYPSFLQHLSCERPGIYVEANTTQRTIASARAIVAGVAPECPVEVHFRPRQGNPLFAPSTSRLVDKQKVTDATDGRMGNQPDWFASAFAAPLANMHRVLMDCNGSHCDKTKPDFRSAVVRHGGDLNESPVAMGADFAENFLLQYTEGMPMDKVGWGRVSREDLNSLMEMNTRYHDFMLRTPYFAQVAASDLAVHLRDTILGVPGQLGTPQDRLVLLVGHDANLSWLGGLLRLDWLLPDQTFNATPPGSALVFEVHQSKTTGASTVRVLFVSQTLDQIRNLRPLTGGEEPSVAPVYVPGCSGPAPIYACTVDRFAGIITAAIDPAMVEAAK
jgi:4-phytase/acid phosphatase